MLIERDNCLLLIVDIQTAFIKAIDNINKVISNNIILLKTAEKLNLPIVISEQYPKGLGNTVDDLIPYAKSAKILEKIYFNCSKDKNIAAYIKNLQKKQIIISGIEAHICVLQSALGFKQSGFDVFVVADACASRDDKNAELAYARLRQAGVNIVSTEMVVFELLEIAGNDEFRQISKLIK